MQPCSSLLLHTTSYLEVNGSRENMSIPEFLGSGSMLEFIGTVVTLGVGLFLGQMLIDWWKNKPRY